MNRIDDIFARLASEGRRALMPFIVGGFPRPGLLGDLLPKLEAAGASIIEVGIPFSDPIADGQVISAAMHKALAAGSTARSVVREVAEARSGVRAGLVGMVSVSIVHRAGGPQAFAEIAATRGFDGLIVPDMPLEESGKLIEACRERGVALPMLVAPTSPEDRVRRLAEASTGFVYLVATAGVTGERTGVPDVARRIELIRSATSLPVACGFGISTPEQAAKVAEHADGVIVGSALVRRMAECPEGQEADAAARFVSELAAGLAGPGKQ